MRTDGQWINCGRRPESALAQIRASMCCTHQSHFLFFSFSLSRFPSCLISFVSFSAAYLFIFTPTYPSRCHLTGKYRETHCGSSQAVPAAAGQRKSGFLGCEEPGHSYASKDSSRVLCGASLLTRVVVYAHTGHHTVSDCGCKVAKRGETPAHL